MKRPLKRTPSYRLGVYLLPPLALCQRAKYQLSVRPPCKLELPSWPPISMVKYLATELA